MSSSLSDHATSLLQALPAAPAREPGRPPSPARVIGLDLVRLILSIASTTGQMPWHFNETMPRPRNAKTGKATTGINTALHLTMRAAHPTLALVTATPTQWASLGAVPHANARAIPYVFYKAVRPDSALAVPVRGALIDVTGVEFRDQQRARAFQAAMVADHGNASGSVPGLTDCLAAITGNPERCQRIDDRFDANTPAAQMLVADLAAAYAAAGQHAYAPPDVEAAPCLTLLAGRPEQFLWMAAEAQRLLGDLGPHNRPRARRPQRASLDTPTR